MNCTRCGSELWGIKTEHDTKDECIQVLRQTVEVQNRMLWNLRRELMMTDPRKAGPDPPELDT